MRKCQWASAKIAKLMENLDEQKIDTIWRSNITRRMKKTGAKFEKFR